MNLEQHVKDSTHKHGNILDLLITRSMEMQITDLVVLPYQIRADPPLDHFQLKFKIPIGKPEAVRKKITYRKTKDIDLVSFRNDIIMSSFVQSPSSDLNSLVSQYNDLAMILEKHAPTITKHIVVRPESPWYTDGIRQAKIRNRKAERIWRKTKLTVHLDFFRDLQSELKSICDNAKTKYYSEKVNACEDQKQLFGITNDLLSRKKISALPTCTDFKNLANDFANFFTEKVKRIRDSFPKDLTNKIMEPITNVPLISELTSISENELQKLLKECKTKSCGLDPIPTSLLKNCTDILLPSLLKIVNMSISTNSYPDSFKTACVTPLLKKPNLDCENLSNYRPVSNLPFVGKLVEKVVIAQLNSHITKHNLDEPLQSAYRPAHSTETALTKINNDILCALDEGDGVMLVLLDLSVAFDTVDTDISIHRLHQLFGISGNVSKWIQSYFTGRFQYVSLNGSASESHPVASLPQGSNFGPFSFPRYTTPIGRICEKYGVSYHLYADDTQLYLRFKVSDFTKTKEIMEMCIEEIRLWMANNNLKLNDSKTEFLIIGSKHFHQHLPINLSITIGQDTIKAVHSARNIGAIIDDTMDLVPHINMITKSCYAHLRCIGKIRKFLTRPAAEKLIHAFISSRLDGMNSLLVNANGYLLDRLQKIQNQGARIVVQVKKFDRIHMTPFLCELHWLPIRFRIKYKILLLTYKCKNNMAPSYLSSMLKPYLPKTNMVLRSSKKKLIEKNGQVKVGQFGKRAFSICAPILWEELDNDIRHSKTLVTFKSKLKTYLFKQAFEVY
jgi:hypothetical protein